MTARLELTPAEEAMAELRQRIGEATVRRTALAAELVAIQERRTALDAEVADLRARRLWLEVREAEQEKRDLVADKQRVEAELTKVNGLLRRYHARIQEAEVARQTPDAAKARLRVLYTLADAAFDVLFADGDDEELLDRLEDAVAELRQIDPMWRGRAPITRESPPAAPAAARSRAEGAPVQHASTRPRPGDAP